MQMLRSEEPAGTAAQVITVEAMVEMGGMVWGQDFIVQPAEFRSLIARLHKTKPAGALMVLAAEDFFRVPKAV